MAIMQLVARKQNTPYKQRVGGSNPSTPTPNDQALIEISIGAFLFLAHNSHITFPHASYTFLTLISFVLIKTIDPSSFLRLTSRIMRTFSKFLTVGHG